MRRTHLTSRRGVTLVEVLIVVAIMALISAGIGFLVMKQALKAQINTTITRAQALRSAVMGTIAFDPQTCPTTDALVEDGEIEEGGSVDAWDQPFAITCESLDVLVVSKGPDRVDDTEDDIRVPIGQRSAATAHR